MRMGGPPGPGGYGPPGQKMPGGYPPNSYNGPSYNGPHMGPPGSQAPGMGPPGSSPGFPPGAGYPPGAGKPPAGYPSPSSTPNSLPPASTPTPSDGAPPHNDSMPSSGTSTTNSVTGPLVTTGPDGQPMHDETSQQSTLSQSSDNSGGRATPKGGYPQVSRTHVSVCLQQSPHHHTLPHPGIKRLTNLTIWICKLAELSCNTLYAGWDSFAPTLCPLHRWATLGVCRVTRTPPELPTLGSRAPAAWGAGSRRPGALPTPGAGCLPVPWGAIQ